jgi:hypothetical protein
MDKRSKNDKMKKEIQQVVKSTMNQKLRSQTVKWIDSNNASNVSNSAVFSKISTTVVGTSNGNRIGNKIRTLSMSLRGTFNIADTTNVIRLVVFKWLMNDNSDTPSASEILTNTADPQSNFVPLKPSRFKVLHDTVMHFDISHTVRTHTLAKKKLNYDITYDGTSSGIGQLYYMLLSDSGAPPHPAYILNVQVLYVDSD